MILVDLEVPSMRKSYQFSLEENCLIETLIEEIAEMISQKEHCPLMQTSDELELYSRDKKCALFRNKTLAQLGICEADELILL